MDPYRPLHVVDEPTEDVGNDPDDRVLAALLIVLGLARVIPAMCRGEAFGAEVTAAAIMLVGGLGIALALPRKLSRARRWVRRLGRP